MSAALSRALPARGAGCSKSRIAARSSSTRSRTWRCRHQAKILRVLQSGEIQKVGAERTIKVDVRVLSGTHKDLKKAVANGAFREDLYYRLNVVPLRVPACGSGSKIFLYSCMHISRQLCEKNNLKEKEIDEEVLWELKRYPWPGNVRELQNVLERMLIMSGERMTVTEPAGGAPDAAKPRPPNPSSALREFRDRTEREYIVGVLRKHQWQCEPGCRGTRHRSPLPAQAHGRARYREERYLRLIDSYRATPRPLV